jgi:hypothetical protein
MFIIFPVHSQLIPLFSLRGILYMHFLHKACKSLGKKVMHDKIVLIDYWDDCWEEGCSVRAVHHSFD